MIKLGFSLESEYDRPLPQVLRLLKNAGFSAISPAWSETLDLGALVAAAKELGMSIQSLHASHKGVCFLWEPENPEAVSVQAAAIHALADCAKYQIPVLVMHCWKGHHYVFREDSLDFRFFDRLAAEAAAKGVCIALENLEGEEFLAALLNRYQDHPNVGFCWDSGHDHCYPHQRDFLKAYGDRLAMTHLNDNLGIRDIGGAPSKYDDLHFLPGDGDLDWDTVLTRLKAVPRQEALNFELKRHPHSKEEKDLLYAHLSLEEFITLAGIRAKAIAERYES